MGRKRPKYWLRNGVTAAVAFSRGARRIVMVDGLEKALALRSSGAGDYCIPRSHRYRVTDAGFRTALFFTRTYNRLLRPAPAAVLPDHHAAATLLKRSFNALDTRIARQNQLGQSNLTHSREIPFLKQT